jgi:hypothetical protein
MVAAELFVDGMSLRVLTALGRVNQYGGDVAY